MKVKFLWVIVGSWMFVAGLLVAFAFAINFFPKIASFSMPLMIHLRDIIIILGLTTFVYVPIKLYKTGMRRASRKPN